MPYKRRYKRRLRRRYPIRRRYKKRAIAKLNRQPSIPVRGRFPISFEIQRVVGRAPGDPSNWHLMVNDSPLGGIRFSGDGGSTSIPEKYAELSALFQYYKPTGCVIIFRPYFQGTNFNTQLSDVVAGSSTQLDFNNATMAYDAEETISALATSANNNNPDFEQWLNKKDGNRRFNPYRMFKWYWRCTTRVRKGESGEIIQSPGFGYHRSTTSNEPVYGNMILNFPLLTVPSAGQDTIRYGEITIRWYGIMASYSDATLPT